MTYPDDYLDQFCYALGLNPRNSADAGRVTNYMNSAMAIVDQYCHRNFAFVENCTERFIVNATKTLQVKRFPLTAIDSITYVNGLEVSNYLFDAESGIVVFNQDAIQTQVEITYSGGFDPIPPDVLLALQGVCRKLLSDENGDSNQSVRRIQTPDVGMVEYFDQSPFMTASGLNIRFGEYFHLLEPYRVYSV